jgi:hypothetical protein
MPQLIITKTDPDPSSMVLAIMGLFGTYLGVGLAVKSQLDKVHSTHKGFEDQARLLTKQIRRGIRTLQDEWEDMYALIENVAETSKNGYLDDRFKAGLALLLTKEEMGRYVQYKTSINQSVCEITGKLNSMLNVVVAGNPAIANVYIELIDYLEKHLNSILIEGCTYREVHSILVSCLEMINTSLREGQQSR